VSSVLESHPATTRPRATRMQPTHGNGTFREVALISRSPNRSNLGRNSCELRPRLMGVVSLGIGDGREEGRAGWEVNPLPRVTEARKVRTHDESTRVFQPGNHPGVLCIMRRRQVGGESGRLSTARFGLDESALGTPASRQTPCVGCVCASTNTLNRPRPHKPQSHGFARRQTVRGQQLSFSSTRAESSLPTTLGISG